MALLAELFSIVAPVLFCAGIGFVWAKLDKPFDTAFVTNIVMNIGTPALIISTFLVARPDLDAFWEILAATGLVFLICGFLGLAFLRIIGLSVQSFLPVITFPNAGNMGLPLCLFAFGTEGLALAIVFFTVASVLQFTLGAWVAQGRINLKESFRTPLIYAVVLSVLIVLNGVEAPRWFTNTITLIGNLTIPLMLLALGVSLARLKISSFAQSLTLSLFRLAVGFSVGLGISFLLDLEGTLRGVLILQSSLSPAVYNYLFAERFGSAGGEVAGVIVLSTFLTFLLLPAVLVFLL